jgi:hypothetical protein
MKKKQAKKRIKVRKIWKMNPVERIKISEKLYKRPTEKIKVLKIIKKED